MNFADNLWFGIPRLNLKNGRRNVQSRSRGLCERISGGKTGLRVERWIGKIVLIMPVL
jgi:hypothetical protein